MAILISLSACQNTAKKELESLKQKNALEAKLAERNKANTLAFLKALEDMNVDSVVNLFAEDGKHINPYASGIFSEGTQGHEGIRAYWEPVFPNFEKMQFPVEEIHVMQDPSMTFVKFKGKIKLKNNAGWYENDYYATFEFDKEGKITRYVEIFNPIVAARGFGLLDKIK
ncbi:MAG: nuclear transport factor 2 family protein [Bacteroidetes bacterium]|nr:nuclear transport factor 2 family protein [Bacteroidota bacterium]